MNRLFREFLMNCQCREVHKDESPQVAKLISTVSSPVFEFFGVATCVKNGQYHNTICLNHVMNYTRKTAQDHSTANFAAHFGKVLRIISNAGKIFLNRNTKFLAQAFAVPFVPGVSDVIKSNLAVTAFFATP